jgi:hypothetical protein
MVIPSSTGRICPICKQPFVLPDKRTPGQKPSCACSTMSPILSLQDGRIVECNKCGDRYNTAQGTKCPNCGKEDFTEVSKLEQKEKEEKERWHRIQKSFMPPVA